MSLHDYNCRFDEDLEEFILKNKETILSTCLVEKSKKNDDGSLLIYRVCKDDIQKRWHDPINSIFGKISMDTILKENIIFFCEVMSMQRRFDSYAHFSLPITESKNQTSDIFDKLVKMRRIIENKRSRIVDKYYNHSGYMEYLLEDGSYVAPGNTISSKMDVSLFPVGFISLIDASEYRSLKIDKIYG